MKKNISLFILVILVFFASGCGETVNGVVKDTKRIGSGIKKVFVREQ